MISYEVEHGVRLVDVRPGQISSDAQPGDLLVIPARVEFRGWKWSEDDGCSHRIAESGDEGMHLGRRDLSVHVYRVWVKNAYLGGRP